MKIDNIAKENPKENKVNTPEELKEGAQENGPKELKEGAQENTTLKKDKVKTEKPAKVKECKEELPAAVERALKVYSNFPKLYVDSMGGIFMPGTPEYIRKGAKLYENKYYTK